MLQLEDGRWMLTLGAAFLGVTGLVISPQSLLRPGVVLRVLRAGRYSIPSWYSASHRVAHWTVFSWPEKKPDYTFNPEVFPESPEAQAIGHKLMIPPGPNNPVGVAWISLDKPGYGMHGTPNPEQVGRTESHGCFRLANWNAEYLLKLVNIGTPVFVEQ